MSALDLLTDIATDKIPDRQLICRLEDCGATLEIMTHGYIGHSQLSAAMYVRAGGKNKVSLKIRACFAVADFSDCHLSRSYREGLWVGGTSFNIAPVSVEPLVALLTELGIAIEDYRGTTA